MGSRSEGESGLGAREPTQTRDRWLPREPIMPTTFEWSSTNIDWRSGKYSSDKSFSE
jgi:hypothetical protein